MAILERIQFMKVNRHKRYEYTPRYYDARKERLQKLIDKHNEKESDLSKDDFAYRERIKQRIADSYDSNMSTASASRAANIRLIIILAALLLASYFILDYVDIFANEVTNID